MVTYFWREKNIRICQKTSYIKTQKVFLGKKIRICHKRKLAGNFFLTKFIARSTISIKKILAGKLTLYSNLQHPNIVRLLGLYTESKNSYMVMEFVSKGSLKDLLKNEKQNIDLKAQIQL